MKNAIFTKSMLPNIKPTKGLIVAMHDNYYILADVGGRSDSFLLVNLMTGHRYNEPIMPSWEQLTYNKPEIIDHIWPDIKSFLKDVNL